MEEAKRTQIFDRKEFCCRIVYPRSAATLDRFLSRNEVSRYAVDAADDFFLPVGGFSRDVTDDVDEMEGSFHVS